VIELGIGLVNPTVDPDLMPSVGDVPYLVRIEKR
jgi:hypothetical protein